ncbi:hypothetical protein J6590_020005 [Homalodisca vitripennis]|nr:hypothetical protein J6590_020005 [Homalodisca vitripennis]
MNPSADRSDFCTPEPTVPPTPPATTAVPPASATATPTTAGGPPTTAAATATNTRIVTPELLFWYLQANDVTVAEILWVLFTVEHHLSMTSAEAASKELKLMFLDSQIAGKISLEPNGQTVDATQEIMTLGVCNIFGAFVHSLPVAGSFTRSAVNAASGVRTQMRGVVTSGVVVLALEYITPYFHYIPRTTLAAVVMCAVLFMVEVNLLRPMWATNKRDVVPAMGTFLACLALGVELGLGVGVLVDLCFLLYFNARPDITIHLETIHSAVLDRERERVTHNKTGNTKDRHCQLTPRMSCVLCILYLFKRSGLDRSYSAYSVIKQRSDRADALQVH